jgi:hypothetical protein
MNIFLPLFFLGITCLIYLGYQDIKTREINVLPIYILSGIGLISFLYFGRINGYLHFYLLQIAITFIFLVVIYFLGKFTVYAYIGEGDLLAIMMISFVSGISILFAPFVFIVSMFLMLILPMFFFSYNLIKGNFPKKSFGESLILMFLGFPKAIKELDYFYTPLEKFQIIEGKIISKTMIKPDCSPDKQIDELKKFSEKYKITKVWVSPLIPFILTIVLGYIIVGILTYFNMLSFLGTFAISFV